MQLRTPDEYQITEALRLGEGMIFNYMDARKFLLVDKANKNPVDRLISYLICLKIIYQSREKWVPSLLKVAETYYEHVKFYFEKDSDDPLSIVPTKSEVTMKNDFPRTVNWYNAVAPALGVDLKKINDAEFRISRMFAILAREHPEIVYTQGYDRYGFIYYAMCLLLCQKGNLPVEFGEAIAYNLLCNTLSLIPMSRLLDNQPELVKHFTHLDNVLLNYDREKYDRLSKNGASLLLFGVRFELLLFADEHDLDDTFRIWDQIFGRLENYDHMISAFTIAHIHQIQFSPECVNVLEEILHFEKWNMDQLIIDANELLNHRRSFIESICEFCCPKLPFLHGYSISEIII